MPDITTCANTTCWLRAGCRRNEASGTVASEHRQSVKTNEPVLARIGGQTVHFCPEFWPVEIVPPPAAPLTEHGLVWKQEPGQIVAYCGDVPAGAIWPGEGNMFVRWQAWLGEGMFSRSGITRSDTAARNEVAKHFGYFLARAGLMPAPKPQPDDAGALDSIALGRV